MKARDRKRLKLLRDAPYSALAREQQRNRLRELLEQEQAEKLLKDALKSLKEKGPSSVFVEAPSAEELAKIIKK